VAQNFRSEAKIRTRGESAREVDTGRANGLDIQLHITDIDIVIPIGKRRCEPNGLIVSYRVVCAAHRIVADREWMG
jgi:hypothetical protein